MNTHTLLSWLENTPLAEVVRENGYVFPWVECVHVIALSLVVGSITIVDLRLLGLASRERPVTALLRQMLPLTWAAFALAIVSGVTLFLSNAQEYWADLPFRLKFAAMSLAGINMLAFHLVTYRSVGRWDSSPKTPWPAKLAGALSITLWISIVAFGRWIGFTVG